MRWMELEYNMHTGSKTNDEYITSCSQYLSMPAIGSRLPSLISFKMLSVDCYGLYAYVRKLTYMHPSHLDTTFKVFSLGTPIK